jgi:hypothetical protein
MKPIGLLRTKAMKPKMLGNWNGIDMGSHARSAQNIREDQKNEDQKNHLQIRQGRQASLPNRISP